MPHPVRPGWITLALLSLLTAALPAQELRELALARASIRAPAITAHVLLSMEGDGATAVAGEASPASVLAAPTLIAAVGFMPRMESPEPASSLTDGWGAAAEPGAWSRSFLARSSATPRFACFAPQSFGLPEGPLEPPAPPPEPCTGPTAPPAEWFELRLDGLPAGFEAGPGEPLPKLELAETSPLDPATGGLALYPW